MFQRMEVNLHLLFTYTFRAHQVDVIMHHRPDVDPHGDSVLLRAIAEQSPDAIFVKDLQGRYLFINSATEQFVGRNVNEILGRDDTVLFDQPEAARIMEHDSRVIASGEPQISEVELTIANVTRTYLSTKAPYRDSHGNIIGIVGISRDITEWKHAQDALRLRDRAIQAVGHGILITDALKEGNPIIYANPSFETLTGYSATEVLGRMCCFLGGPATDPDAVQKLRLAIRSGTACVVELLNYRKDGTPFWNEISISPIHDDVGKLTHFVSSQADVTERRTLASQIQQMQKMEALGRLAGGIAHDFNNLLTIISGYNELFLDQFSQEDPRAEFAEQIKCACERAASLTQQLLAFSRRQLLQPVALDLNVVIGNLEKMILRLIGEDVETVFRLKSTKPTIVADRGQIEQVLLNLCLNARDAMPRGGILTIETVDVELDQAYCATHPTACPGPQILLAVTDTGSGMEKSILSQIFTPFFTTKGPDKGTGLGLATIYGIVQQSGGHIEVYSEVGIGTSFKVYLPSRSIAESPHSPAVQEPAGTLHGNEAILLVEDEAGVRTLAGRFLRECGYMVMEARNSEEALRAFAEHHDEFQLVITDVVMPGISGRELGEQLRMQSPGLKVIYMSAYTEDAIVRHGVLSSECDFIHKPFTSKTLSAKVREVLDR